MAIIMKRQLTEDEKKQILDRYGRRCFATGHSIPEGEPVHFDHIRAFSSGGPSDIDNIAPMCETHNKQKGRLPLENFKTKLRLQEFFNTGDKLTLKHLLQFLQRKQVIRSFGEPLSIHKENRQVILEAADRTESFQLHECPTTNNTYFYAILGIDWLDSDDDEDANIGLQPRYLIFDKVFNMYRHFQVHPVLQPSVGRVVGNRIRLFDGQHKIAALLWTGRRQFECKVYVDHDIRLLNQTNIAAHDKFAQTRFFSPIMVLKLGTQFGNDFELYKSIEDGEPKSEAGFMKYLEQKRDQSLTRGELNKRFRNYLYNSVLDHTNNKLSRFVSPTNRSTDKHPITIDMLKKSLFSCFLYRYPAENDMNTSTYLREAEINNVIEVMNMLHDLALSHWAPHIDPLDTEQRKLSRLFRSKSIMAWSEIVRDAIVGALQLFDADEREMLFYRHLSQDQLDRVESVVSRLIEWPRWSAPADDEIDRILADNKRIVKKWFKEKGLTTGYLMGAPE